jgi:hypothetical protein
VQELSNIELEYVSGGIGEGGDTAAILNKHKKLIG